MTTASHSLYLYRATELVTVRHGSDERSILRASGALLGERSPNRPTAGLLAVDDKGTVLRSLCDGRNETYEYLPYGYDARLPSAMSTLGFNGEALLAQPLGYALGQGYRWFSPARMRFNAPDHLSPFAAGGLNAYCYCEGDPVNYVDPTGGMKRVPLPNRQVMAGSENRAIAPNRSRHMPPSSTSLIADRRGSMQRGASPTPLKESLVDPTPLSSSASPARPRPRPHHSGAESLSSLAGRGQKYMTSDNPPLPVPRQDRSQASSPLSSAPSSRDSTPPTSRSGSPVTVQQLSYHVRNSIAIRDSGFYSHRSDPVEYPSPLRPQRPS